jgi:hypothetical protein
MTALLTVPLLKDLCRSLSLPVFGIANPRAAKAKSGIPTDVTKAVP